MGMVEANKTANNNNRIKHEKNKLSRKFEAVVKRAEKAIIIERSIPAIAVSLGVAGSFLAASWFNVWSQLPAYGRVAGVALFATALIGSVAALRNVKKPSRDECIKRIDSSSNVPHRPASVLDDDVSSEIHNDSLIGTKMWELHKEKTEKEIKKLRTGWPKSNLKKQDPLYLRYAIPLLLGASAIVSLGNSHIDRVNTAFDWNTPVISSAPVGVEAWITPPHYTGQDKHFLSNGANGISEIRNIQANAPEGSILTVRFYDNDATIASNGGIEPYSEDNNRFIFSSNKRTPNAEHKFKLDGVSALQIKTSSGHDLNWVFDTTPDNPPEVEVTNTEHDKERAPNNINVTYKLSDEYKGAQLLEGRITPVNENSENNSATPLVGPPKIRLPLN
jgi:hypothetical protein